MAVTFVEQDEYYDPSTAWPSSLALVGAPTGTSRGDRLFLVVLSYNTTSTLDNWNLGSDWTLLGSSNRTISGGAVRSSIHFYTARHQDGAPLPVTISPRTSGGTLITDPGGGAWYRAHLYSVTPSHPVYLSSGVPQVMLGQGSSTSDQPQTVTGGVSGATGSYIVQLTAVLNPNSRTLGTVSGTGGGGTFADRASMSAVTGRGGQMRVADTTATGSFSGADRALYPLGGSGGSISVRSALVILDPDPDIPLPSLRRRRGLGLVRG